VKYRGLALRAAADGVLAKVASLGGHGGVIVLDRSGEPVFAFNTEGMYRGFAIGSARPQVMVFR